MHQEERDGSRMNLRSHMCRSPLHIGALLAAAAAIQGVVLARAELPAADAARYAAVAQSIERSGLAATWREEPDPLGFALWAVAVRRVLLAAGLVAASDWAAPLQVAAALPLVLLPALVYRLLRYLVGQVGALTGAAFFTVATEVARLGASGIADSLLLLFQVLALWAYAEHLTRGSRLGLLAAGLFCGAAVLVKGTSVLLPAAMLAALAWETARCGRRWNAQLGRAFLLAGGCLVLLVPAAISSGATTFAGAAGRLFQARVAEPELPLNAPAEMRPVPAPAWQNHWRLTNGEWMTFGKKDPQESIRFSGWLPAIWELFRELMQGLLPWGLVLAVWGGWSVRGRPLRPIDRLAIVVAVLWCVAAFWHAVQTGYLSTRHVLPVVVLGCGWCGLGVVRAGRAAWHWRCLVVRGGVRQGWGQRRGWRQGNNNPAGWGENSAGETRQKRHGAASWWSGRGGRRAFVAIAAGAAIVSALPRTLAPFHGNRAAHRQAGRWLAAAVGHEAVLDTHAWTGLYSGRRTWRFDQAERALLDGQTRWLVVEERELAGSGRRARTLRELAATGMLAASFVSGTGRRQTRVVVYRWNPEQLARGGARHAR